MKAQKIQQNLRGSLNSPAGKKYSNEKMARINSLIAQAEDIVDRTKKLSTFSNLSQIVAEISQIVKRFEVLESSYRNALESS
jgi:hypothetical protein